MSVCPHEFWEREASVETEGLCPLCLCAEVEQLKMAMHVIRKRSAPTTHSWESAQDAFKDINQEASKALEGK